jgi:8-oxo-dGTP pyrophosphatase MutT (NUDIX family)
VPASKYLRAIRSKVGHRLLLLPAVTAIVHDDQGRILLTKNVSFNQWFPPGGHIEPDESPKDAVIREMREETGLLVEPVRIVGVYGGKDFRVVYPNGDVASYITTVFECVIASGHLIPDPEEVLEIRFFSKAELKSKHLPTWVRTVLRETFDH